jgi:NTE family protein
MSELGLGGLLGKKHPAFLLDNGPLKKYLASKIKFSRIRELMDRNELLGFGISVTNYATGSAITFYDCSHNCPPWARTNRLGLPAELKLEHVLASTAIPILFPAVRIGQSYYGDGAVRMKAPLSPAIHLGASSILAIGLRYYRTPKETVALNETSKMKSISLADVAGVLLNGGFLDNLDGDIERLERINHTLSLISTDRLHDNQLRSIETLAIRPSQDLGEQASECLDIFGPVMKYLLKGLGTTRSGSWDLISYLAFDKEYTTKLLKLGYEDGMENKRAILEFFESDL